ncbi:MAG: hypothetical protein WAU07_00085 [Microgenomates group bacterium]
MSEHEPNIDKLLEECRSAFRAYVAKAPDDAPEEEQMYATAWEQLVEFGYPEIELTKMQLEETPEPERQQFFNDLVREKAYSITELAYLLAELQLNDPWERVSKKVAE